MVKSIYMEVPEFLEEMLLHQMTYEESDEMFISKARKMLE